MNWFRKNLVTIILVGLMFIGVGLIIYPSVSDYWNSFTQSRIIMSYADSISEMDSDEYERIMSSARQYNEELKTKESRWNMTEEEIDKYFVEDGDGCPHYQEDYSPDPSLEEFEEKELNK